MSKTGYTRSARAARICEKVPGNARITSAIHCGVNIQHELMKQIFKFFISYLAREFISLEFIRLRKKRENWVKGEGGGQEPFVFVVKCI